MKNNLTDQSEETVYSSSGYRRSRNAYIFQAAFEWLVMLLAGDVFLATLLRYLGVSDSLIGIISSFVSVALSFQILSVFLVRKLKKVKVVSVFLNCLSLILFLCAYTVPFLPVGSSAKIALVMIFILFAYAINYIITVVVFKWTNSFVHPARRASYSATKEIVSLIAGMVFTLAMGYAVDRFAAVNRLEVGFLVITVAMLVLNICNFIMLMLIKKESRAMEQEREQRTDDVPFREVLRNTLGNRNFISVVFMTSLWYAARYMTLGYLGIYKLDNLLISVGLAQVINFAGNLCRIAISKPFGKYSDRHSFAKGMRWGLILEAVAYLFVVFTTPETWWLIIGYTVLYNVGLAGLDQNSNNIVYSYVDSEYLVQALAIKNSIAGIVGFLTSLAAGKILNLIQSNNNMFFGIRLYGQQILALFSVLLLSVTIVYLYRVIEKQKVKKQ